MSTEEITEETTENKPSVARSTAMMSLCTLASRATGFIRTWAMAFALGNTIMAAGFALANNLPNMIYELVAGGVLSTAFLPIFLQQLKQKGDDAASLYASNLLSIVLVVLGVISVLASVFAPQVMITQTLFSATQNETVEAAVWFFRFLAFEILFYGISAVLGGLLNAKREFFWPAVSSIFMNIICIIAFFGYPVISSFDLTAATIWLGVLTTLSIAVMMAVQIPPLVKTGFKYKFFIDLKGEGLRDTVKLALPAVACTAINLVSLSFMNSCALHVANNGPSSVSYAWMWYMFPYGVLGVALSTAMFTEMSECTAKKDWEGFKNNLRVGLKTTWMLIIPMAALVFACSWNLVGLYAEGKFTAEDIEPIAILLQGWAVNLPIYAGYMFVYRAYSAMKDMKTIAICNLFLTVIQVLLYMTFTGVIEGGPTFGLIGIAFADICFYILMLVALLTILNRRLNALRLSELFEPVLKVLVASVIGAICAFGIEGVCSWFVDLSNTITCFVVLIVSGFIGLNVILFFCKIFNIEELNNAVSALKRRLKRS